MSDPIVAINKNELRRIQSIQEALLKKRARYQAAIDEIDTVLGMRRQHRGRDDTQRSSVISNAARMNMRSIFSDGNPHTLEEVVSRCQYHHQYTCRILASMVTEGCLVKIDRGVYRRNDQTKTEEE